MHDLINAYEKNKRIVTIPTYEILEEKQIHSILKFLTFLLYTNRARF